jgi:hypothetical protein
MAAVRGHFLPAWQDASGPVSAPIIKPGAKRRRQMASKLVCLFQPLRMYPHKIAARDDANHAVRIVIGDDNQTAYIRPDHVVGGLACGMALLDGQRRSPHQVSDRCICRDACAQQVLVRDHADHMAAGSAHREPLVPGFGTAFIKPPAYVRDTSRFFKDDDISATRLAHRHPIQIICAVI